MRGCRIVSWVARVLLAFVMLAPRAAKGDAIGEGLRSVSYAVTFENLAAYPQYVFYLYPTTNSGFAYRVEPPNKAPWKLMLPEGSRSGTTELWAVKKADFDKFADEKEWLDHGDNGEKVQVFKPVPGAVKADKVITRPKKLVAQGSPQRALARVFKVEAITDRAIQLTLVKNEMTMADGAKVPVPYGSELDDSAKTVGPPVRQSDASAPSATPSAAPAPWPTTEPKKRGCGVAGEGGGPYAFAFALAFALGVLLVKRRR